MAKKIRPFGRQIAKLKDEARKAAGDGATPEALAEKAQELADKANWDYLFTVASFADKPKGKRGRKARQASAADNGAPVRRAKAATALTLDDVEAVKGLANKLGADTVRRLLD